MSEMNSLSTSLAGGINRTFYYYENGKRNAVTFPELLELVEKTVSYLKSKNITKGSNVGILSMNSFEWVVLDLACVMLGAVTVPFHDRKSIENLYEIFDYFELELLFSDDDNFRSLNSDERALELSKLKERISDFPRVKEEDLVRTEPDDVFSMVFTSGTTGVPKAIEMPKKSVDDFLNNVNRMFQFQPDDKAIIFLPLSHFGQRSYIYGSILFGFDFVLVSTDNLFVSFKKDQPTILVAVPYFFENLFKIAGEEVSATHEQIIRSVLGGKMRIMLTGSAPISKRVLEAFHDMNIPIYEAYGTNETGLIALNYPGNCKVGSVGKLFPNKTIRINDDGVICVKSDFAWGKEYYKDENAGKGIFLHDGFINTGDIGQIDDDGFVYLKGRASQLIILSNGKKVHPQSVETKLLESKSIKQVCLFGNNKPHLTAVIVAEKEASVEKAIEDFNVSVPDFMNINRYITINTPFSQDNGFLTSSLKINRKKIFEHFESEIAKFY